MNSYKIPKQLYRFVFKAITENKNDSARFTEIYEYVRTHLLNDKQSRTVPHLKAVVKKILTDFLRFGLIYRDKNLGYRFAMKKPIKHPYSSPNSVFGPNAKKRKVNDDADSVNEENTENSQNQNRNQKNLPKRKEAQSSSNDRQKTPTTSEYQNLNLNASEDHSSPTNHFHHSDEYSDSDDDDLYTKSRRQLSKKRNSKENPSNYQDENEDESNSSHNSRDAPESNTVSNNSRRGPFFRI